jgi:hypothetical protein
MHYAGLRNLLKCEMLPNSRKTNYLFTGNPAFEVLVLRNA